MTTSRQRPRCWLPCWKQELSLGLRWWAQLSLGETYCEPKSLVMEIEELVSRQ